MVEITPEYLARSGTEHGEQAALFCAAGNRAHGRVEGFAADPRWTLLYAIPNGGARGLATAANLKAEGVKAGFPDIGLPIAARSYHGLFIEMKRTAHRHLAIGKPKLKQNQWHQALHEQGYYVCVCYGWIDAVGAIEWYLSQ